MVEIVRADKNCIVLKGSCMNKMVNGFRLKAGIVAIISMCGLLSAQTADQLKTRFATLLGADKYAKLVWQEEGNNERKPNFDWGGTRQINPNKIKAMDTKDGIVKQIAGAKLNIHYSSATLSWDGAKIIYTENVSHQMIIVDWADTTKKTVVKNFEGDGHCYQTSDSKNWMLATEYKGDTSTTARLMRINIADTSEKATIFTCTWARAAWGGTIGAGSTCWASISSDGKYVAGGFPNYGAIGILTVESSSLHTITPTGCWPSMARDATGDVLYTVGSHTHIRLITKTGTETYLKALGTNVLGGESNQYESLRWTSERDYISIYAYKNSFSTEGISNPRLVRVSDLKWAAVVDAPSVAMGNMDAYFYTGTSIAGHDRSAQSVLTQSEVAKNDMMIDTKGRVAPVSGSGVQGVFISPKKSGFIPSKNVILK